jgi:hypothetical protein
LVIFAVGVAALHAQVSSFRQWTANAARTELAARSQVIAGIQSVSAAEVRKAQVRSLLTSLLGGLPTYAGPLNAQVTGVIDRGSFRIEKILLESMPGIRVSANLYVPQGSGTGPFPAILFQIGHEYNSKASEQLTASNLALKGFVVITFDPLGQGERLQGYNPATGTSLVDWGVPQHFMAGAQSALVGQSYARYEIFDAKRVLDYLLTRPEVDPARIGATGCSGGGTLTTFASALDDRIKVAAPACYINSFSVLLPDALGDSEQSWPNFVSSGLDQTDFVELFAPRPFLILSTQEDFFTPAGAKVVYDEAKIWYGLYNVSDRVQWLVGPGPHGTPLEVRQAIYSWMIQWLKQGAGDATEQSVTLLPDASLQVTPGNYVGGSDIYTVIRQTLSQRGSIPELVAFLNPSILYTPQIAPPVYGSPVDHGTYSTQPFTFSPEQGVTISAAFLIPKSAGVKPAAINFETVALGSAAALQLVQNGSIVLDILPRALPRTDAFDFAGEVASAEYAWLIGRNLPGMRAKDLLQGADLLLARPDVAAGGLSLYANGAHGIAALYAAAVDQRIGTVVLDHTPYSFTPAMNSPGHIDLHSALIPGYYLKWDIASLVSALGRRNLVWTNPTDWLGNVVSQQATTPRLTAAVAGKGTLGAQYYVDLAFTNSGPGSALGTAITSLGLRTLAGSGAITAASLLPIAVGDLGAGVSQTVRILLNVPAGVARFSIAESGTLTSDVGAALTFSISQAVTR